jgi:fructokinase
MVLIAGEALIDMIPFSRSDNREGLQPTPGGSPYNVAVALGRLGMAPLFLCGFSNDAFGRLLPDR